MSEDQLERIDELFARARLIPHPQRADFLARECPEAEIRSEVLRLLETTLGGFLEIPRMDPPERIGPYRIVRELGRGGMGVVYLADQEEGVRRQVALKIIQSSHLTPEIQARFESEKQALALMNHPAIAKVFDAGITPRGAPYFVMEYVDGRPLALYCDTERLPLRERLRLFIEICEGVQHAHQKGIIHRDIKSANVLVALQDGRPVPKIIDFGIAKALGPPLAGEGQETQAGRIVGTLDCMAPEQLDWGGRDVDTRADVYALGVLLYDLLAGSRPFDISKLRQASLEDALRLLRQQPPESPSARLRSQGKAAAPIAAARRTEPGALVRSVRGDLDGIVLHALEKDRDRRYASASELAADVRRHLANEPVLARTPGPVYRFGRFALRHKAGVAATALVTLALVGGTVGTMIGMLRARGAERLATKEAEKARQEAETAERVTGYLVRVFRLAEPEEGHGATVSAREILDQQVAEVRGTLKDDPGVQGRVMRAMGEAYSGLGLYKTSIPLLEEALPKIEAAYGRDSTIVYDALNELGNLSNQIGAFATGRGYFEKALSIATRVAGPEHPDRALILKNLGDACVKLGDLDAGRGYIEEALSLQTRLYGEKSGAVAKTQSSLAALELKAGRPEVAVVLAERSLATRIAKYGSEDPAVGHGHFFLGEADLAAGRFERARADFQAALPIWERSYGPEHANVGECLFGLAKAEARLGRPGPAYQNYRRARLILEKSFDQSDPRLAGTLAGWLDLFAGFLQDQNRHPEAESTRQAAARIREHLAAPVPE